MKTVNDNIHRLIAPRLIAMIGTTSADGRKNIIPINNITSISTEPGMILVAIYRPWITAKNLQNAKGFTVSVPTRDQLELIWKLAPKYSGYESGLEKLDEFKMFLNLNFSLHGPVIEKALGWIECEIVDELAVKESNHLLVVGKYTKASYDEKYFTDDLIPINNPKPIMQWAKNKFSAADDVSEIPFLGEKHR